MNKTPENCSLLSKRRNQLIKRATPAEQHIIRLLDVIGIDYIFQKGFLNDRSHYIVDFYFPRPFKLCLEIDGDYHKDPQQQKYDARRDRYLKEVRGFKVLRISNEEAFLMQPKELETLINHADFLCRE